MKLATNSQKRRYTAVFAHFRIGFESLIPCHRKPSRFNGLGGFFYAFPAYSVIPEHFAVSNLQRHCTSSNQKGSVATKNGNESGNGNAAISQFFRPLPLVITAQLC